MKKKFDMLVWRIKCWYWRNFIVKSFDDEDW